MKHAKVTILIILMIASSVMILFAKDNDVIKIRLDELGVSPCYLQDWGSPQVNQSVLGTPLTVNGTVYKHGLGTHSISRILLDLKGKANSISGLAGADDNNMYAGKLQFKIIE